ncbi:hypothetical protein ACLOJK_039749 [Asimina triloba]
MADNETPLHVAAKNGYSETAKLLVGARASLEAKSIATTKFAPVSSAIISLQAGKIALDYVPEGAEKHVELRELINQYFQKQKKQKVDAAINTEKGVMAELNTAVSSVVGLHGLKSELEKWAKAMVLNDLRSALAGLSIPSPRRKPPHMVFLGNPGTGKTTVARIFGKLLKHMGILSSDKVIEVQRTDLVAEYIGQTGPKTRKKIEEARGGNLFVDEAYRLANQELSGRDFGLEALEEIMAVMESAPLAVIFAGYVDKMNSMISSNDGLKRRIAKFFVFDNYTCADLAEMTISKIGMGSQEESSELCGLRLHQSCSAEAIAELIERETTEEQRNEVNGTLVQHMLQNALDHLNFNLSLEQMINEDELHATTKFADVSSALSALQAGKRAIDYVPEGAENVELRELINHYFQKQKKQKVDAAIDAEKGLMAELNAALSSVVGLHGLKSQLDKWAKAMVVNDLRRALDGSSILPKRKLPHLVFLCNPGTDTYVLTDSRLVAEGKAGHCRAGSVRKTTVARILRKLLKNLGILSSDNVIEVQRTDLVAEYIGQTGPKTQGNEHGNRRADFEVEAFEEIMAEMEGGNVAVIFAGY